MLVYVSQRVDVYSYIGERRDALDGRWHKLLGDAGFRILPVPNDENQVELWLKDYPPSGILLSGGNTPSIYGGAAPERCKTDNVLMDFAIDNKVPVVGVCRGMQSIALYFGGSLKKVDGHVRTRHKLRGKIENCVNSYHEYAVDVLPDEFSITARAEDGVIEAISHKILPIAGFMWHPEREEVFSRSDIKLIKDLFHWGSR